MYDNYNYPMGADTPSAPWNEKEIIPVEVNIDVNITLSRKTTVESINYEIYDTDDRGSCDVSLLDNYNDIKELYIEQHYDIPDLLDELAKYINGELQGNVSNTRKQELHDMLADCKGWQQEIVDIDEYEIVK